ncbi:MAG: RNA polymerase ECF-type sigma factor [uncultured Acidimicrobiales bacterium]|uniref:RNA polymerase ECF-type sigma factor n=1 Tax=uncultured Acidimicrobiales bacterium TaxID=310071 RepID=A0A6J4I9W9_9ACTN|nr:MAG: RNA polymerase ECF-type sigma factor [uncultured Acidimicrobiales bacterium]
MTAGAAVEILLRELAPQALAAVVRRHGSFADAEDALQEALVTAATTWPVDGLPDKPLGWLVRVASRRMTDRYRQDEARRRREDLAASRSAVDADPGSGRDDSLILMFLCCHPALTPAAAIPLTLRAVGGLTTREIASAFLVPEATMAQRISRAKAKVKASDEPFGMPPPEERDARLRSVRHVLYLLFNEGYATSSGSDLGRTDLSGEAIRLARAAHRSLPDDQETSALLALMLLTDARRPARARADGELVPLAEQDRSLWDRALIVEGIRLITEAMQQGRPGQMGEYQLQAAIAALHDQASRYANTDWASILSLYGRLERMTGNPMVTLNRAVAAAMVHGPATGLRMLEGLEDRVGDHHRLHSVRAHLHELAGDTDAALREFRAAADRTSNVREQHYLTTKAARLVTAQHPRP